MISCLKLLHPEGNNARKALYRYEDIEHSGTGKNFLSTEQYFYPRQFAFTPVKESLNELTPPVDR